MRATVLGVNSRMRRTGAESGTLPLVLLPGTLCDERVFAPLLHRLGAVQAEVLLTPTAPNLPEAARQVLAKAPPRFALLGFSLGGMVAMEAALCAPERVRGLALLSTTARPVPAAQHRARRLAAKDALTLGMARFVRDRLWPQYCAATEDPGASLPLFAAMAESMGPHIFSQQTEVALGRRDFRDRLGSLRCPALVLAGDRDRLCPPDAQEELAAALPGCTHRMLPGAGHLALVENADEVAAAVAAWFHTVNQVEESA